MSYTVAVRALCEFTAKRGDLDLRFTPAPTAQEGMTGHQMVALRRAGGYQAEISLSGEYEQLTVRGRADGYDPAQNQLEEIKTYRGDLKRMPDNHRQLHWAQACIYGWLLCQQRGLSNIKVALVYFNVVSQKETVLSEAYSAEELQHFFVVQCQRFLIWAKQELSHRAVRDEALAGLPFPYAGFRPGQRQLAESVYKAASLGRCLMAEAPTGIGKTVGTLFPLLKALPAQQLDKVCFLAAKTPGRRLALDALALIRDQTPRPPLRVLELVARDKACEHPDKECHGESCPLAQGFYDRLPEARQAAVAQSEMLDQQTLRQIALAHQVCPYYLSQDLARWADVVVGDYNYYFDMGALLYGLALLNQWRMSVLVDEAHNLVERARKMYSAELDQPALKAARKVAPPKLKRVLDKVNRAWDELNRDQVEHYQVYPAAPEKLLSTLQQAGNVITDYLTEHPTGMDPALQRFYFDALHFGRLAELLDQHSLFDVTLIDPPGRRTGSKPLGSVLCCRNVIPAPFLKPRFEDAHAAVLFSATLSPWNYYADILGLPEDVAWMEAESPFRAEQLVVHLAGNISTRYQHRDASLTPISELMANQYQAAPGNYLAFFSSYDYLHRVLSVFRERYPEIPIWEQARNMEEVERERFLARFTNDSRGIGFAVLGGSFGEGIDLPGSRLIGAFVATLGLPQINPVNEQIRQRMQACFGAGYDYTYLYPGLQKVVQAAGRVIRTQQDQGVVHLIDDRFARQEVRDLLPRWWAVADH
ncbi:ATP-dependent DNA helicase [Chitinimonas naiadis]